MRALWRRRILAGLGSVAVLSGLTVTTAAPASAAAGLNNGGFEQPAITPENFRTVPNGEAVGAWRVTGGDVDIIHRNFWQPAEGDQSLDLNGLAPGTIEQDLSTLPLFSYDVTFSLAGNPDLAGVYTGQVLAGDKVIKTFSIDSTGNSKQDMRYVTVKARFEANGTTTKLAFRDTSGYFAVGPVIDKVAVKQCLLVICLPD